MTEVGDYTQHSTEGYYKQDHMLRVFWNDFRHVSHLRALNAGCGKAQSLLNAPHWQGFDFNPNLVKTWKSLGVGDRCIVADARELPYEDDEFDFTVSCDFLEHVKPEDLETVAGELKRVAREGVHIIDQAPISSWKDQNGETLHPAATVPQERWVELFGGTCLTHHTKRGFLILQY